MDLKNIPQIRYCYLCIVFCFLPFGIGAQSVVINEFSVSNLEGFEDNLGKYPDWIELYNATDASINLTGYYLSDKIDNPTKWQIPAGVFISPNDHRLFICDSRDEISFSGIHTNFKLTQMKQEYIVLSDPSGTPIDFIQMVNPTQQDHTRGRITDGGSTWGVTAQPSPAEPNIFFREEYADPPIFSELAGFYDSAISLTLISGGDTQIRYTLDGSEPNIGSPLYNTPIALNNTTVVKAKSFSLTNIHLASFTIVNTYFINETHALPVLSLSSNRVETLLSGNDFDRNYVTHAEYFEEGERIFDILGHCRPHGNDSWNLDQRGVRFYVEDDYGYAHKIDHQLFPSSDRTDFDVFILKASASDNYPNASLQWDRPSCHLRDAYVQELSDRNNLNLDERRYRRCIVYVNGDYWGIYEMRERIDSDYTKHYYDQGESLVDMLEYWGGLESRYGSDDDWETLYDFMIQNDLSIPANYEFVKERLDLGSLIDYVILNTFVVNTDWLNWNTKWWRGRKDEGTRWRYCLWDMDNIFGLGQNFTGLPDITWQSDPCDVEGVFGDISNSDIGHIEMMVALFENEEFFQQYASRYADLAATTFSCESMLGLLDEMIAEIEPEMPRQIARWNGSLDEWYENLDSLRFQIENKCVVVVDQVADCYEDLGLTGPFDLMVDVFPLASGRVQMNTAIGTTYPWTASYFGGIDLNLTALPEIDFVFSHWEVANNIFGPDELQIAINLSLEMGDTIIANFSNPNCGIMADINGPNEVCEGSDFSLTATVGFATYLWSNGTTESSMLANTSGIYSLTVTDENGCFGIASFEVNGIPTADLQIIGALEICRNSTINLTATLGFEQYSWSDGTNSESIEINAPGTYSVSVVDENNCEITTEVMVEAFAEIIPTLAEPVILCGGGSGILRLLETYPSYLWSDGSISTDLLVADPGDYSVTVTGDNGCTGTATFTVDAGSGEEILVLLNSIGLCSGNESLTAEVSGAIQPLTYDWSTGATTETLSNLVSGTYSLTITDAVGCTESGSTSIEIGVPIDFVATMEDVSCVDATDGMILLEITAGTPPFIINWSNGGTGVLQENLSIGDYVFEILDGNDCSLIGSISIGSTGEILPNVVTNGTQTNTGSAIANASGGQGPYTYQWSTGETGIFIENLTRGVYSVTITDTNGCTGVEEFLIDYPTATALPEFLSLFEIYPNPSNGIFTIDLILENSLSVDLKIVDLKGRTIYFKNQSGRELSLPVDISSARAGTYFLMIETDKGMAVKSLVLIGR